MNKADVIERLAVFKDRLIADVVSAYSSRGGEFGRQRFASWKHQLLKFLDESVPGASGKLTARSPRILAYRASHESDVDVFMREDGRPCLAFIDSLVIDLKNDEVEIRAKPSASRTSNQDKARSQKRVFVVHGHDAELREKAARFLERLGCSPVILHEQASQGMTIIEKIEACSDVGFAVVLYTPDDKGNTSVEADAGNLNFRARQNVVFEHGYLIAKLTRANVVALVSGSVELPSDISGIVYVEDTNWQVEIAREMLAAGYEVDFNRILKSAQ